MTTPLRVLVVDDSATVRARIRDALRASSEFVVVGEASTGREAIERCDALRPDVMTLDMVLPELSGQDATEHIMAHFPTPTPILIVSSSANRGELFKTYEALAAGAVDIFEKPNGDVSDDDWDARLIAVLRIVARVRVITHLRGKARARLLAPTVSFPPSAPPSAGAVRATSVVAVGASTGGPAALVEVLRGLPAPAPVPVLLVLHIGAPFAHAFASWLDEQSPHRVRHAVDGESLERVRGEVLLAPGDRHMEVHHGRIVFNDAPPRHSCKPSVDVLFESLALSHGSMVVAALLTGMGKDGARGLLAIREAGGFTIAQDEATSVVYGMPREAALLGAAMSVLPLGAIGRGLADAVRWPATVEPS